MARGRPAVALAFSCLGHSLMHLYPVLFFVTAVSLQPVWEQPYHELIELWTIGAVLVGAAALPAGWLADRWSFVGMMVVFFIGLGAASIASGLSADPAALAISLAAVGLFAAIYHPVGIPWVVRQSSQAKGRALAINGIFGSGGVAAGGLVAGVLIHAFGWRAALIVPGLLSVVTGAALLVCWRLGIVDEAAADVASEPSGESGQLGAFGLLLVTMFGGGLIFQATQAGLPKLFDERLADLVGGTDLGLGALIAAVYGVAAFVQLAGGYLADRAPLKRVYLSIIALQVPVLILASAAGGVPLIIAAMAMVSLNSSGLPAENMLLARYSPARHHGVAFGFKFVLAFGAAPLAIALVSWIRASTGGFGALFISLAATAAVMAATALLLPNAQTPVALAALPGNETDSCQAAKTAR